MKTKVYLAISIRLILLFATCMATSFATPHMREFFGDTIHVHSARCELCTSGCTNSGDMDNTYEWGTRHYWYLWMMILLFILSLINFVMSVINIIKRNYDTSQW